MNRKLAIVGTHPETRELAPFHDPNFDIWVFNETAGQVQKQPDGTFKPWAWRVDGVFQMHQPPIYRSKHNRCDPNHWAYLKKDHKYPIWMLADDPDVPNCEPYPLENVMKDLLGDFSQGLPPTPMSEKGYFTSSIAYAIALGIWLEQYEVIDIYGIEVSSATEYTYQRDCVAFWTGLALGRKIEVTHYGGDAIYGRPLYGYEGALEIPAEEYAEREKELKVLLSKELTNVHNAELAMSRDWPGEAQSTFERLADAREALTQKGFVEGAIAEIQKYAFKMAKMKEADDGGYIDRNEFEGTFAAAAKEIENWGAGVNQTVGVIQMINASWLATGNPELIERIKEKTDEHLKCAYKSGYFQGRFEENKRLANRYDQLVTAAGGSKATDIQTANDADS